MKFRLLTMAAAAALALGLAGCGATEDNGSSSSPTSTPTETQTPEQTPTDTPEAAQTPESDSGDEDDTGDRASLPNEVGKNHQEAQDDLQSHGFYNLREKDCTGAGRLLLFDRNWKWSVKRLAVA
jgi:hypothetical protein